ncbi:MAG: LPS assembly lipoprotein LptE [Ascidiaceihabitans sp.]|nr:LPS assembly lipoprotein LptE [Ascidiaceihabitans sp.]
MSWFKLLFVLPLIAACGFTPVYGPGGVGNLLQNNLLVDEPTTRQGFFVTRQIEDRLGRAANPDYALAIELETTENALAIDADGEIARYNILGTADFALRDLATGAILETGTVNGFTGYSATGTTVASLSAQRDATERLMTQLADHIVTHLYASTNLK